MSLISGKKIISSQLITLVWHRKGFSCTNNHSNLADSNLSSILKNMIEKAKKLAAFRAIDDHLKVPVEIHILVN